MSNKNQEKVCGNCADYGLLTKKCSNIPGMKFELDEESRCILTDKFRNFIEERTEMFVPETKTTDKQKTCSSESCDGCKCGKQ